MSATTVTLERWADVIDAELRAAGMPVVFGGQTFSGRRAVFDIPAPETGWSLALARKLGVSRVQVRLQIEVCQ